MTVVWHFIYLYQNFFEMVKFQTVMMKYKSKSKIKTKDADKAQEQQILIVQGSHYKCH